VAPREEIEVLPCCLVENKRETPDWCSLVTAVAGVDAIVSHDTAVAHLGAALGKKVVALFGSRSTCWFAPYGNECYVVTSSWQDTQPFPCGGIKSFAVIEKMRLSLKEAASV
jgi:ADP-heptose:LPS heptosyltransferase